MDRKAGYDRGPAFHLKSKGKCSSASFPLSSQLLIWPCLYFYSFSSSFSLSLFSSSFSYPSCPSSYRYPRLVQRSDRAELLRLVRGRLHLIQPTLSFPDHPPRPVRYGRFPEHPMLPREPWLVAGDDGRALGNREYGRAIRREGRSHDLIKPANDRDDRDHGRHTNDYAQQREHRPEHVDGQIVQGKAKDRPEKCGFCPKHIAACAGPLKLTMRRPVSMLSAITVPA